MIIINDGDGKGKTTAAIGQAIRAAGHGLRVKIIQFIKNGDSGELKTIEKLRSTGLNIDVEQIGAGFTSKGDRQDHIIAAKSGLKAVAESIANYDMIIADEINYALSGRLIEESEVLNLMKLANDKGVHFILTGRGSTQKMQDLADTVTMMMKIKHAYDCGIKSQMGIEF